MSYTKDLSPAEIMGKLGLFENNNNSTLPSDKTLARAWLDAPTPMPGLGSRPSFMPQEVINLAETEIAAKGGR